MTINQLLAIAGLTADDEIPVWDNPGSTPDAKITAANLASSIKTLASLIATSDLDTEVTEDSTNAIQSRAVYDAIQQSMANMPLIYKPTGTITTNNIGAFTLNTGISLSGKRVFVLSNYGVSNSTQYNFFVDSFDSAGAVNLRVRKIGDGTAVTDTSIDLTKIALIIV